MCPRRYRLMCGRLTQTASIPTVLLSVSTTILSSISWRLEQPLTAQRHRPIPGGGKLRWVLYVQ